MASAEDLGIVVRSLTAGQISLLVDMAQAMRGEIPQRISPDSDICVPRFADYFSNRLRLHHATASKGDKFTKKPFEFAFVNASRAAGKRASVIESSTNPGADVEAGGVAFSLKTEGAASMRKTVVTISKLMEAKWIDDCRTTEDFARATTVKLVDHLKRYERILVLRASDLPDFKVRYDLVEIPRDRMLAVGGLRAADFSKPTPRNSSTARVLDKDGKVAFRVRLDGSDAKVTILSLRLDLCRFHGSWTIQAPAEEELD